ncbi:MAG TPA: hypothetical protein VME19_16345 [Streptosporangiaceae bacterium]|nr:hypothetical protein [Streptosporangiaceae bacterium]
MKQYMLSVHSVEGGPPPSAESSILGIVHRAEHPETVGSQLSTVGADELAESVPLAFAGQLQQRRLLGTRAPARLTRPRTAAPDGRSFRSF